MYKYLIFALNIEDLFVKGYNSLALNVIILDKKDSFNEMFEPM